MPAVIPFIPQIIGAGSALAGSLKQNSKAGRTSTAEQQSHRTSTVTGELSRKQQMLNQSALRSLMGLIDAGPQVLQADKNLAFTDINKTYNSVLPRLQSNFTSRGMGQSGALNQAFRDTEFQRADARGTAMGRLQSQAMNRWLQSIGLAPAFLTPRTVSTTEDFMGTGTNTGPSQAGNILGGAGFALSEFLKRLLNGSGGPSVPDFQNNPDFNIGDIAP